MDKAILEQRSALYETARVKNPLRWKRAVRNWRRIEIVYLNPDKTNEKEGTNTAPNFLEKKRLEKYHLCDNYLVNVRAFIQRTEGPHVGVAPALGDQPA